MSVSASYQTLLTDNTLIKDPRQAAVIEKLNDISQQLIIRQQKRGSNAGKIRRKLKPRASIPGLYLYGGVGIGKTFMMDLFYDNTPVLKTRRHFHAFMQDLHQQLRHHQGTADPLKQIAKTIADNHLLICFDEFFVDNIADAMLLGELFTHLFTGGICLIATSNVHPDNLYQDGLQRERFLPAIDLIKQHVEVMSLENTIDYRLLHIHKSGVYFSPINSDATNNLELCFQHYSKKSSLSLDAIHLFGRTIRIIKSAGSVIWFDFNEICAPPRSQNDYLALIKHYNTIVVSNIPIINKGNNAQITLLIKFVDILYDRHIRLIISAAAPIDKLYLEGRMVFEFERTKSRIIEMNSPEYYEN